MLISTTELIGSPKLQGYFKLENVNDSSSNVRNLTNHNSVGFVTGKYSNAADFGASNTNKYLSTSNTMNIDGGNMTVAGWVKLNAEIASGSWILFDQENTSSQVVYQVIYEYNSGTRRLKFDRSKSGVGEQFCTYNIPLGTSNFVHIAMTYNGTTLKGYVNGVLVASVAASGTGTSGATAGFAIGASTNGSAFSSAIIDDVAILDTALVGAEIAELYNEIVAGSNTHSLRFYATSYSDKITIVDASNLKPTGNFTIEGWFKSGSTANQYIFQSYSQNTNAAGILLGLGTGTAGKILFISGKNTGATQGVDYESVENSVTTNDNQWHHVAATWDGANLKLYIDGVLVGTTAWANAPAYAGTNYVRIGCSDLSGTNGQFFDGSLNDIRLFNGTAKTQAQIRTDMMASALALTTNLVSRWKLNDGSGTTAADSVGSNTGTLVFGQSAGFESWTADVPYLGNLVLNDFSLALSPTGSQVFTTPDNASISLSNDITIETWVKFNSLPGTNGFMVLVSKFFDTGSQRSYSFALTDVSGTKQLDFRISTDGGAINLFSVAVNWTPTVGTWYHITVTKTGTTVKFYVNGSQQGATQTLGSSTIFDSSAPLYIGGLHFSGGDTFFVDGLMNLVRIWNIARNSSDINAYQQKDTTGQSGLVSQWLGQNNGVDLVGFNNLTPVNSPVFITDVPFRNYLGGGNFFAVL